MLIFKYKKKVINLKREIMKTVKNVLGFVLVVAVMALSLLGSVAILNATHMLLVVLVAPAVMVIVFSTGFAVLDWLD